ncbi:hypothetical protein BD309DRAFT_866575 [Dichomitus squalens]|nr:hypothetical protein BD309DRAFT_866575 [Dichomitus squalens]
MAETDGQPSTPTERRSVSRGREAFVRPIHDSRDSLPNSSLYQSSGRGGVGNIRRPSTDPASPPPPSEPLSPVRGRETHVDPERLKSTGRGGMGNIRSGSQARNASVVPENHPQTASLVSDQAASVAEYERSVVERNEDLMNARAVRIYRSSGRGGLGNITGGSKSRSRSRVPVTSTGRGGAGNLQSGVQLDSELLAQMDDEERLRYLHEEGIHSTGRGGRANITAMHSPPLEPASPHPHEYETTGRGGAGNIVRSRSASRDPSQSRSRSTSRTPSKDRASSLARILNKVGIHPPKDGEDPEHMRPVTELTEPRVHE